jgi:sugar-specific transcriptional regulator TrmB
MNPEIKNYLKELGFNNGESKAYLSLTQLGEASASIIAKKANLPRTTVISILKKLETEKYVTTHRYKGKTQYWIESPSVLRAALETKIEIADHLNTLLTKLYRAESHFPQAKIYDTKMAVRNFIEKLLVSTPPKTIFYTIDTPNVGNYAKIFSEKINSAILKKKNSRGIQTKTLIPYGSYSSISLDKIKTQNIEIRELPPGVDFTASVWLIGNLLVHFSGNPPFAVAIEHPMIVDSMRVVYNYLWNLTESK